MVMSDEMYLGDDLTIGYDQDQWMFVMWCGPKDCAYSTIYLEDHVAKKLYHYLNQRIANQSNKQDLGLIKHDDSHS